MLHVEEAFSDSSGQFFWKDLDTDISCNELNLLYNLKKFLCVCVYVLKYECMPVSVCMRFCLSEWGHKQPEKCVFARMQVCVTAVLIRKCVRALLSACSHVPSQVYSTAQAPVCVSRCK